MKKKLLLLVTLVLITIIADSQNLLINGDFEDGAYIVPWWIFVDGGAAAVTVDTTHGSVNFTEISAAGNNTYDIQLIQDLSEDQITELGNNIDSTYYLTLDATVPEERNCNLFLGQVGGSWYNLAGGHVFHFVPEQSRYSFSIRITSVFDAMKFGLEIGTSSVPVEFDNIMLSLTPPVTGINDHTINLNYKIFPNPATDIINIHVVNGTSVSLYSLIGLLIESKTVTSNSIEFDVSKMTPGVYFVKIQLHNTKIIKKIFIQ